MAKNDKLLLTGAPLDVPATPATTPAVEPAQSKKAGKNASKPQDERKPFGERFKSTVRGVMSELKKVDWPPMRSTKNQVGAMTNTSTVLVVTVIFLVLVTAINVGLVALFRLLINS